MAETIVVCADGSDVSNRALAAGLSVLAPATRTVVVTVIDSVDPTLVTGTGLAGGTMTPEAYEDLNAAQVAEGDATVRSVIEALGLTGAEPVVRRGDAGAAICDLAAEVGADAVVIGSRGRGGFKRALLGSVSDHVVRNAPCPVVVTGERDTSD